jgi:hypothetical protein
MRPALIDFLIVIHEYFELLPETLFLAINLFDRLCSRRIIHKNMCPINICITLRIAAKYTNRYVDLPDIEKLKDKCFEYLGISYKDVLPIACFDLEAKILTTLGWIIGYTTYDFLQLYLEEDREAGQVARYICEKSFYHREFVSTKPSVMCSASLTLGRCIMGKKIVMEGDENATFTGLLDSLYETSQVLRRKYPSTCVIVDDFIDSGRMEDLLSAMEKQSCVYGDLQPYIRHGQLVMT